MDEKEIVAQKVQSVTPVKSVPDDSHNSTFDLAPEHHYLYEQFGVEADHPSKIDAQLADIWEWAKSTSSGKGKDAIVFEVIRLKNRLGSANLGEKPWNKVHNYVTYWKQMRDADSRMKELENDPARRS